VLEYKQLPKEALTFVPLKGTGNYSCIPKIYKADLMKQAKNKVSSKNLVQLLDG